MSEFPLFLISGRKGPVVRTKPHVPRRDELADQRCAYCGGPAEHLDHVMPRSRGGKATVPACAPCNLSKRDQTPQEWITRLRLRELDGKPNKVDVFQIQVRTPSHLFDITMVEQAVDNQLWDEAERVWKRFRHHGRCLTDFSRDQDSIEELMAETRAHIAAMTYPDGVTA